MKTRLFLFDLDGTLMSTGGAGLRALSKAFLATHNIVDAHDILDPSGKTDHAIFREIVRTAHQRELTQQEIHTVAESYLLHLEQEMKTSAARVIDGVQSFLDALKKRSDVLIALGTGNMERGARLKLAPVGLNPYFEFGGFGSDAEDRAEMLRVGHRRGNERTRTAIANEDVLVIGDTPLDVAAAHKAGYKIAAVATGKYSKRQLEASGADFVFQTLNDASALIDNMQASLERA